MWRRVILTAVLATLTLALLTGIVYPLVVTGIGRVAMPYRSNGSFIEKNGKIVGSALIGQSFLNSKGDPAKKYFQPRPSDTGTTPYNALASGASNLGPGDPRLVGFIPGFNTVDLKGNPSKKNPFATPDDPYCVPTDKTGAPVASPSAGQKYAKNDDGAYVCFSSTVPERAVAYRELNGLSNATKVPVDAVTASDSGLDPDISVANAKLQVPRVAAARRLSTAQVNKLIDQHTNDRQLVILGEKTINVLDLNLALDQTKA
jgi:K+-transporting ATPase ATPase C chain